MSKALTYMRSLTGHGFKEIQRPNDMPFGTQYMIQIYVPYSYTIPGDERSRTNPGHGHPEETVSGMEIKQFVTSDKELWVQTLMDLLDLVTDIRTTNEVCFFQINTAKLHLKTSVEVVVG